MGSRFFVSSTDSTARIAYLDELERDSRAPTSLRSPTSNALPCQEHPGQAFGSSNQVKAKTGLSSPFCT